MTAFHEDVIRGSRNIALFLGVEQKTVINIIERGGFPAFKIGDVYFARRSTILHWIEQREAAAMASEGSGK